MTVGTEPATSGSGHCVARNEASDAGKSYCNRERRSSDQAESIVAGPLGRRWLIRSDVLVTCVTSLPWLSICGPPLRSSPS